MASKRVASTAFGVAAIRVLEQDVPPAQRLFDDPLVARLVTGAPSALLRSRVARRTFRWLVERASPGFYGGIVCRTRAIDDACREALARGVRQVVLLGAGLDTRPYRLPEMRDARVWELDLPGVQARKTRGLERARGALPPNVQFVAIDFERRRASDALAEHGFDPRAPALVVWEAVSQYLERAAVDDTLRFAGELAASSRLVFTYIPQRVFDDRRQRHVVRQLEFKTGFVQAGLGEHLHAHGLSLVRDLGRDEYADWLRPIGRTLPVFDLERVAVADVQRAA